MALMCFDPIAGMIWFLAISRLPWTVFGASPLSVEVDSSIRRSSVTADFESFEDATSSANARSAILGPPSIVFER